VFRLVSSSPPSRLWLQDPPSGADWVHEIKHDVYRLIVRRDGPRVRLYSGNGYDLTARLPAIAAAAERIRAKSLTIDGEAVVVGARRLVPIRGSAPT
jgi:ATP-dependent DNA ligase